MKKIFVPLTIVILSVLSPLMVTYSYAQTTTPNPTRAARLERRLDAQSTDLKSRGDEELTRRITALNGLIIKINGFKKLSDSQKSTFTSNVQTEITTLTTLKTKIDGDTDVTTLKTDVQSIVTSYRVFALYMPQINILTAADRILTTTDTLTALVSKLQTRITEAQTKGKNVTLLTASLTDMQNKIADAKTQAQNAINSVTPLTPAGYPGNKTTLIAARGMITAALTDLEGKNGGIGAKQDAQSIIQGLKPFPKTTITPSPSK